MLRSLLSLLALFTIIQPAFAQSAGTGIELLSAGQISIDQADHPHIESHIAVDPRDPQHLLATSMVVIDGKTQVIPYASFDGGKTWARGQIIGDSMITSAGTGDPIIYITNSGVCLFSTLSKRTLVARSIDGGRTWRTTSVLPFTDRQWMALPTGRGPFSGRTYLTGTGVYQLRDGTPAVTPFLARSDDEGLTFPFQTLVAYDRAGPNPVAPLNAVPQELLVTPLGLLVLTLQGAPPDQQAAEQAKRDSLNAWGFGLMISDDGGESFGPARYAPIPRLGLTGSARRSYRQHAAGGVVRTAIDSSSGRFNNRIYFVSPDYDPKIDRYVARMWYTGDFGKTWGTAMASDAARGDIANPAIAVNRNGIVAVTWNDRRDDPEGRCWRLYAALSIDGGEHFLPAQRLSNAPTCTNAPRNWETFGSSFNSDEHGQYLTHFSTSATVPTRFPMGGDTQGLVADGAGVFHAAWINGETGVMQLWYSSFRVDRKILAQQGSLAAGPGDSSPAGEPVPAGMEDVTRDVSFRVTATKLDFDAHLYTVTVEIENKSGRPLRGPFRAAMRHFLDADDNGLGLRDLAVANADSGGAGIGAAWVFEVPGGILAPGASSSPRVVQFTFKGGIPDFPEGYLSPGFRVYGRAERL